MTKCGFAALRAGGGILGLSGSEPSKSGEIQGLGLGIAGPGADLQLSYQEGPQSTPYRSSTMTDVRPRADIQLRHTSSFGGGHWGQCEPLARLSASYHRYCFLELALRERDRNSGCKA